MEGWDFVYFDINDKNLNDYRHMNPKGIKITIQEYSFHDFKEKIFDHYDPSIITIDEIWIAIESRSKVELLKMLSNKAK